MVYKKLPVLAAAAVVALTTSATAQITKEQQSALRANCRSDFMSHCSGVTPGGKDALMCLQKNVASLSSGCQTAVRATMPAEKPAAAAPPAQQPARAEPPPVKTTSPAPVTQAAPPAAAVEKPQETTRAPARKKSKPKKAEKKTTPSKPAAAAMTAPQPVPAPAEEEKAAGQRQEPTAFAPGAAVIAKACARYLVMHCPGEIGGGRAVACLTAYRDSGHRLGLRCSAALKLQQKLR